MGYHKKKKKLYMMGGEMEKYKKGGKMPSWLLEMFKKKAKKSMPTGGKLERATRATEDRVATDTEGLLDNLSSMDTSGKEKRFGIVERYDEQGNPYAVKKGLLGEKRNIINPLFHSDEEDYIVGTVKNRNRLGKMLTGSDAKAEFGKGGKMYYVTGGEVPDPPEDDIPMLDPNADFLTKDRYVEEPGIGFQDGFFIEGDGPIVKGLTLGSETLQTVGGEKPQLATMYLGGGEGKMQKKIEKKDPEPTPDPDPRRPKDMTPMPRRGANVPEKKLQESRGSSVPMPMDRVTRQYKLAPSMKTGQMPSAGKGDLVEKPGMVAGRMIPLAGDSFVRAIPEEEIADYKFANQIVGSGDYLRNKEQGPGARDKVLYPDYDAALLSELSPRLFQEYRRKYGSAPKPGQALEFLQRVEGYEGYEGSKRSDLGPGPVAYDRYSRGGRKVSPGYEERAATIKRGGGGKLYHFGG